MNLTEEQSFAVNEIEHHLQIIACAGSGKTEVIVRRIVNIIEKHPEINPEQIVAFTFTEKAADSMKTRIEQALLESGRVITGNVYVNTIHGFCFYILKKYIDQFEDFNILNTVKSHLFVSRYYDKCGMSDLKLRPYIYEEVKLFLECIDKMVNNFDNYSKWEELHRIVFMKYRACLHEYKYFDFAFLIFEAIQHIENNRILKNYLSSIKYLIVDEYQDIDDMQEKLIQLLSTFGVNVCIVGDDDQTIYQFRGSNADNMIHFSDRYQGVVQVRLEKNFRCAEKIVDIAACVIGFNKNRIQKKMYSKALTEAISCAEAEWFGSEDDEYKTIAEKIVSLHEKGIPYSEIAILVRKRRYIEPICMELDRYDIPYDSDSAEYFFSGVYFKKFESTMRVLVNMDKARLYECWQEVLDRDCFNRGFSYLKRARRGCNGLDTLFKGFIENVGFLQTVADDLQEREYAVKGFVTILSDYDEIYRDQQFSARITGLLNFLERHAKREYGYHNFNMKEVQTDTVQVMTVHKSKGLEFNTVFLPELKENVFSVCNRGVRKYWEVLGGIFEENKDKFISNIEDERKLFYVALTRAKQNLYLYYSSSGKKVSRFVTEAAQSKFLDVEKADLYYEMPEKAGIMN